MAATVIDSFVVTLGLDPTQFNAQQRKAVDSFKKSQDELESRAQNTEKAVTDVGTSLGGMARQAAGFLAAVGGGKALVQFSTEAVSAAASANRLSRSIGQNVETMTKWQGLARSFGGDAATMASSFTTLSDAFAGWKIGIVSPIIADFRAISTAGGKIIDVNKGVEQSIFDLSDNLKAISDQGPEGQAQAGLLGRRLGLDPASITLLMQGSERLRSELAKIQGVTKESADAAEKLDNRWSSLMLKLQRFGMEQVLSMAPDVEKTLGSDYQDIQAVMGLWDKLKNWKNGKGFVATPTSPASGGSASAQPTPGGVFTSQAEKAEFIRETARKNGIDPEVALRVAKTEGFNNFVSTVPGEKSYGAFQLNRSKTSRPSLGDMFVKDTGLDPSDPKTEKQGIEYALKYAATSGRGWADWYGARNNGIGQYAGIPQGSGGGNTTTIDKIEVNVPAGSDGRQIARGIQTELQSRAANANSGPQ